MNDSTFALEPFGIELPVDLMRTIHPIVGLTSFDHPATAFCKAVGSGHRFEMFGAHLHVDLMGTVDAVITLAFHDSLSPIRGLFRCQSVATRGRCRGHARRLVRRRGRRGRTRLRPVCSRWRRGALLNDIFLDMHRLDADPRRRRIGVMHLTVCIGPFVDLSGGRAGTAQQQSRRQKPGMESN